MLVSHYLRTLRAFTTRKLTKAAQQEPRSCEVIAAWVEMAREVDRLERDYIEVIEDYCERNSAGLNRGVHHEKAN